MKKKLHSTPSRRRSSRGVRLAAIILIAWFVIAGAVATAYFQHDKLTALAQGGAALLPAVVALFWRYRLLAAEVLLKVSLIIVKILKH